jgi:hypothetical protein
MKEIKYCKKHGDIVHFLEKSTKAWRCTVCRKEAVQRRRYKLKIMAVEYKGGKCSSCGYNKCISALDFHHLYDKKFSISMNGKICSWETLRVELDKCILLCANCHRELHHSTFIENKERLLKESKEKVVKDINCKNCNSLFRQKRKEQMYCTRKCQHISMKIGNK